MATIYDSLSFSLGTFNFSTSFKTTTFGGSDAPISGYPEIAAGEAVKTVNGSGPSGERVCDAYSSGNYSSSGLVFLKVGSLSGGFYDCTDGVSIRWRQFFSSTALTDSFTGQITVAVTKMGTAIDDGLFSGDSVVWLGFEQTSGANFFYDIFYKRNGSTIHNTSINGTADNAWHDMEIQFKPGTITGAVSGGVFPCAADGYLIIKKDSVALLSVTNAEIQVPINTAVTTTANLMYGNWFGFAGMLGQMTGYIIDTESTVATSESSIEANSSTPCCGTEAEAGGSAAGDILAAVNPEWTAVCGSGGTVPTAADLTDAEDWDQ